GHATYNSTRVHFGLGDAEVVDTLVIRWPSGHVDKHLNVQANQIYEVIENVVPGEIR
ncbi:MAG: ASPIC/UnbV domain-containing protein, partial [Bacteroidales bacterium]|nr:ASPIC/UnbV domain-containing protein [Bacteroidales bacterium]